MAVVNTLAGSFGTLSPIVGQDTGFGYLIMRLSADAIVNASTLVCAGYTIRINLDYLGNILPNQTIWPNDIMTPGTVGYHVSAYTAGGQLIWGPNFVRVISSPSPYNTNAWVPS